MRGIRASVEVGAGMMRAVAGQTATPRRRSDKITACAAALLLASFYDSGPRGTAAAAAAVALGIVLLCLAWAGRWMLDRTVT